MGGRPLMMDEWHEQWSGQAADSDGIVNTWRNTYAASALHMMHEIHLNSTPFLSKWCECVEELGAFAVVSCLFLRLSSLRISAPFFLAGGPHSLPTSTISAFFMFRFLVITHLAYQFLTALHYKHAIPPKAEKRHDLQLFNHQLFNHQLFNLQLFNLQLFTAIDLSILLLLSCLLFCQDGFFACPLHYFYRVYDVVWEELSLLLVVFLLLEERVLLESVSHVCGEEEKVLLWKPHLEGRTGFFERVKRCEYWGMPW